MKIIITTPLFPPEIGTPAKYIYTLAKKLSQKHEITILTYSNNYESIDGVKIYAIPKNKNLFLRLFLYTKKLIKLSKNTDIIYSQRAVASGLPSVIAGKITKTPVIVNYIESEAWERLQKVERHTPIHQSSFRNMQKIPGSVWHIWHIEHFVLKHAQKIIVDSNFLINELSEKYDINKKNILLSYNAPKDEIKLPFSINEEKYKIFINTELTEWNDVQTALRSIAMLIKKYPNIKLIISGSGIEKNNILKTIKELSLNEHVNLLGEISTAEKIYHIKSSSLFLSTSRYEEHTNSFYEAFREKKVVVATNIPAHREIIKDNYNGFLIPPGNAEKCAEILDKIFCDENMQKKITNNAYKDFENKFSWEKHIEKLIEYFSKI